MRLLRKYKYLLSPSYQTEGDNLLSLLTAKVCEASGRGKDIIIQEFLDKTADVGDFAVAKTAANYDDPELDEPLAKWAKKRDDPSTNWAWSRGTSVLTERLLRIPFARSFQHIFTHAIYGSGPHSQWAGTIVNACPEESCQLLQVAKKSFVSQQLRSILHSCLS